MEFLEQVTKKSRLLEVLFDNIGEDTKSNPLFTELSVFLADYSAHNGIDAEKAIDIYSKYVTAYAAHCKHFLKTGLYPPQTGANDFSVTREEYDIVMIMFTIFTNHRFRIMQLIKEESKPGENALYIGLGPGLEIALAMNNYRQITGYDLSINDYLYHRFPEVHFNAALYTGQQKNYYDSIYLIELLEHVAAPYELLSISADSLKKGGRIYLTTATDIPQFDHLYNFPHDHSDFEKEVEKLNCSVILKEAIPHHYMGIPLKAFNHFYIIEKR